jgi:hypothetical protein
MKKVQSTHTVIVGKHCTFYLEQLGTTIKFFDSLNFLYVPLYVTPLHRSPLQNATILKMKSDSFVTDTP